MSPSAAGTQAPPLSHRRWALLAFLTAGMFFCYVHRGTLPVAAPFLMRELGIGTAAMGVLLSAFFWSYALAQVPAGWLVDRYGLGPAYAAGFLVWSAAAALTGAASSAAGLIAARVLMGLGQGVPFPASARAVANWFPAGERGGVTGLYISGNRLGQAAIAAAGPAFITAFGWRAFFFAAGAAGLLWLAPWLASMRAWDRGAGAAEPAARREPPLRDLLPSLLDRRLAGIFFGYFAYDYVWFLFLTWIPGYLMLERKFGPREMGIYSSVPFVAGSAVVIGAGMLGDLLVRRGWNEITARKILITAGLLLGCLIVPAGFVGNAPASAWLLACSICGLGITAPNAWALTQAVCERRLVATASGIQNLGGNLAGIVAPALTGLIAQAGGSFAPAFALAGAILLCGTACYWLLIPSETPGLRQRA